MKKREYMNRQHGIMQLSPQGGNSRFPRRQDRPSNNPLSNCTDKGMHIADAAMVDTILAPQWLITVNGRPAPTWQS